MNEDGDFRNDIYVTFYTTTQTYSSLRFGII